MRAGLVGALLLLPQLALAQRAVEYEVAFPNAAHHEAEVAVTFADLPAGALQVRMSRSSPGRYALHEFAKNVYSVRATDGQGRVLPVSQPDPYGWTVTGHDGTVRFAYTLFGDRADGTYAQIDATHAHLNMPATFAWARGLEGRPIAIRFRAPDPTWRVATQLHPTADSSRFTAPNLQYFMDSPTEVSAFTLREVRVGGQLIRLALHHEGSEDEVDEYMAMITRVVQEQLAVFGEMPRFDSGHYTFIADYLPWASGDGMEHRNSTILTANASLAGAAGGLLGAVSHEFFHAWNVERIRPRSLEPFDFERANMSGELWFAEGFTDYYGPLLVRRAGYSDDGGYAREIGGVIEAVVNSPGRRFFSAVEMSRQAPFVDAAASIDDDNRDNTFISYYTWGAGIGLALDLSLRDRFRLSLDGYMRAVWQRFGKEERPYNVAELRDALAEYSRDRAFADDFFRRYVEGREAADYTALLSRAGFLVRPREPGRAWLGDASLRGGTVLARTLVGTPLYEAGIDRGDRILSLDGRAIASDAALSSVLAAHRPGDVIPVEYETRGGIRRTARLALAEDPALEVVTYEAAGMPLTAQMRAFRQDWLGAKAPNP